MKRTDIEWTDLSSNPLKYRDRRTGEVVWGCVKHSAGCAHCYSEAIARHYDRGGPFTRATMEHLEPFLDDKELHHILTAKTIDKQPVAGSKCFLGDMTDVFGEWVSDELLDRLFATIALRPDVTFQVLTKRADRMAAYFNDDDTFERIANAVVQTDPMAWPERRAGLFDTGRDEEGKVEGVAVDLPIPNLWLGVSAENQAAADERIPHLLGTPAAVRFLSCEPLLGPVRLAQACPEFNRDAYPCDALDIDWVIVGGESGPGARLFDVQWARAIVKECQDATVPVFVKQLGARPIECEGRQSPIPGCNVDPAPCREPKGGCALQLRDRKGGDMAEWPSDLRVREFPCSAG